MVATVFSVAIPTGVSASTEVDANGPYGTPDGPYFCGDSIVFHADIINGDVSDYYFRWDVNGDGIWDVNHFPPPAGTSGVKGVTDYYHIYNDEYIGVAVVEAWDGFSFKYVNGLPVPDTLRDEADVYVVCDVVECPVDMLEDLVELIDSFEPDDFSNPNRQKALKNKVNAILNNIDMDDLASICAAIAKLKNDILPKTDGERPPSDWVTDPVAQQEVEDAILELIEALEERAEALGGCGG
jgi:hypothetical protein